MDNVGVRTSLTISDSIWRAAQRRAKQEGVSASQYAREAIAMRLAWEAGREGDEEMLETLRLIRKHLRP
jgi:hypothetical protein